MRDLAPPPRRRLLAVVLALAACSPSPLIPPATPTDAPAITPAVSSVGTQAPTSSASPLTSDVPATLPHWRWTKGSLDGPGRHDRILAIWALPTAFVAMEGDREILAPSTFRRSTDGLHWNTVAFPEQGFAYEQGIVRADVLTIIGKVGPKSDPRRQIWTTNDGRSWSRVKGTSGLDFGPGWISDITRAASGWLVLGEQRLDAENARAHLLFSVDGRVWTELVGQAGQPASDGRRFAMLDDCCSQDPRTLRVRLSDDGRHWSTVQGGDLAKWEGAEAIVANATGFAIGGQRFEPTDESSHPIGWASTDGQSWTPSRFDDLPGPDGEAAPTTMLASTDGFIAHGNGDPLVDAVWLSDDGLTWTQVTPLPDLYQVRAYARAGGGTVFVSGPGSVSGDEKIWRGTPIQ
jgi:hypothetical protein